MKILAPVNRAGEVAAIVAAGAEELYCGVLPQTWKKKYTNMASMNRREWKVSNIESLDEFRELVTAAHDHGARVFLTLNALYTEAQYPMVLETFALAKSVNVDAFIIADIGLLLALREQGEQVEIHISTGGTTFNHATAAFYKSLGASRIIIPRSVTIKEALALTASDRELQFEAFLLNRGCKNIDGFCTFHHGVNEVRIGKMWDIPKRLNWDQKILNVLRQLPTQVAEPIARSRMFGSVGACFLSYEVAALTDPPGAAAPKLAAAQRNVRETFNLLTGVDTCGACRLGELIQGGMHSVKIVGRENLTPKKLQDVSFLDATRRYFADHDPALGHLHHEPEIRKLYKKVYGFDCGKRCYYPD